MQIKLSFSIDHSGNPSANTHAMNPREECEFLFKYVLKLTFFEFKEVGPLVAVKILHK